MKYLLKNGKSVLIRKPKVEDAKDVIELIKTADSQTKFLAREVGEFTTIIEREMEIIESVLNSKDSTWFVAEYDGKVIGQSSVGLVRRNCRYRHRAEVAFVIPEEYCNIGIGGKMMEECLNWCRDNNVEQVELDVVTTNTRAFNMYKNFGFEVMGTIPRALRYQDNTYADEYLMVKNLYKNLSVNNKEYEIIKLLGKGKGGYSYLATDGTNMYVLKQIHHEPCDYYQFGNKIESEINDYKRLQKIGIKMPEMIDVDLEKERIIKDFIDGETIYNLILQDEMKESYLEQVKHMCNLLYKANTNIDYFPTNFVVQDECVYYIDFECNEYMEEWNFENWGIKYWSKTEEFQQYVREQAER